MEATTAIVEPPGTETMLSLKPVRLRLGSAVNYSLMHHLLTQSRTRVFQFGKRKLVASSDLPALEAAKKAWEERPRLRRYPVKRAARGVPVTAR